MVRDKRKRQPTMYEVASDGYVPVPEELRGAYKLYEHLANLQSAAQQMKDEYGGCSDSALAQALADFIINVTKKLGVDPGVAQSDRSLAKLVAVYNEGDFSSAANKVALNSNQLTAAKQDQRQSNSDVLAVMWALAKEIYPSLKQSGEANGDGGQPSKNAAEDLESARQSGT